VQHVVAGGDGFPPARVICEIGGEERQAVASLGSTFFQHGAHVGFALQVSYRGTDLMASGEELQNSVTADKA
jgi:hypothetical protein